MYEKQMLLVKINNSMQITTALFISPMNFTFVRIPLHLIKGLACNG